MTDGQLNIFDALATLDPAVVATLEAEPGWVWARCPLCAEICYLRRASKKRPCRLTPGCKGLVQTYLEALCAVCGKPVTARRRAADTRYCSKKCQEAS